MIFQFNLLLLKQDGIGHTLSAFIYVTARVFYLQFQLQSTFCISYCVTSECVCVLYKLRVMLHKRQYIVFFAKPRSRHNATRYIDHPAPLPLSFALFMLTSCSYC